MSDYEYLKTATDEQLERWKKEREDQITEHHNQIERLDVESGMLFDEIYRRKQERIYQKYPEFTARPGDLFAITKEWYEINKWMEVVKLYYPIGSVCEVESVFETYKKEEVVGFTRHTTDRGLRGYHCSGSMDDVMTMRRAYLSQQERKP